MPGQHRGRAISSFKSRLLKPDRFYPLIAEMQSELGDSWIFYEECIGGIIEATADQQGTTAWVEQMQQLVDGNRKVTLSHEGILFLLRDMNIQLAEQQNWGEGEGYGKCPSPPLSLPKMSTEPLPSYIDNDAPPSAQYHGAMTSQPPHQPTTHHASTPPLWRQSVNLLDQRHRVLPFDFSAARQPGLTFPKDLRAFHYPPEQIIMTEGYVAPPPNPFQEHSKDPNPILFTDPAFRQDVAEYFGHSIQGRASNGNGGTQLRSTAIGFNTYARQTITYRAGDNDMLVWKKIQEGAEEVQAGKGEAIPSGWTLGDKWPPWNLRLDLDS